VQSKDGAENMSQRSKTKEPSGLALVPYTDLESVTASPPALQSESRAPLPQPIVAPAAPIPASRASRANRTRAFMGAAAAALLTAAGWFGYDYLTAGRFLVTTDDAYVRAYNTTLGAKVAGYVSEFLVEDNTNVRAGDIIARIDDGDYRLAVN